MSLTATLFVLTWAAIVTLGFALAGVLARVHRLEQRLVAGATAPPTTAGPEVGTRAPALAGVDLEPGAVLLFADRECGSCLRVLPAVADAGSAAGLPVHVFWSGPAPAAASEAPGVVHHDAAGAAYVTLGVTAAPWLVVVVDGRVAASGAAGSVERATALVAVLDAARAQPEEVDR